MLSTICLSGYPQGRQGGMNDPLPDLDESKSRVLGSLWGHVCRGVHLWRRLCAGGTAPGPRPDPRPHDTFGVDQWSYRVPPRPNPLPPTRGGEEVTG